MIDKRLNLITLWNLETFEYKLNTLREQYNRFIEDGSISSVNSGQNESIFLTDSSEEWQTMDSYLEKNELFSPRVIDHAIHFDNEKKSFKRRLSYMGFNAKSSSNLAQTSNDLNSEQDCVDSQSLIKRKCLNQTPRVANSIQTPVIPFTPGSIIKSKQETDADLNSSFDLSNQLNICKTFVYATCRDALNDDDFQSKINLIHTFLKEVLLNVEHFFKVDDEDEFLDDLDEEENIDCFKNKKKVPFVDDEYLKYYARLTYNLNKLMESLDGNKQEQLDEKCSDYLNNNNDQPLYCMKIVMIYSQLSQFRPDYWSLINEENILMIKKSFCKINKLLRGLKESINCLLKVI